MFSQMNKDTHSAIFVYGDFDGKKFTPISFHTPEAGPHFYAPQTFSDDTGRRIIIAWLNSWSRKIDENAKYAGALTIPREIKMVDNKICTFPVDEAAHLLKGSDELVLIKENELSIITDKTKNISFPLQYKGNIKSVDILKDTKTVEVFINNGEASFTYWFDI